ncbi:MAG: PAS domain-containing sensor histidine kinase [Rhodobacterales bacterium]|nr:PAS domain-containing sensor histidine kinase [Rhodobacterales bacterium]
MAGTAPSTRRLWLRFRIWARKVRLTRKMAFAVSFAAFAAGLATLASLTGGSASSGPTPKTLISLLFLDVILLVILGGMVAWRIAVIWAERRRGQAGSGLHVRFILFFTLVAGAPAVLVAVFSALFMHFGVQIWFSERIQTTVENAAAIADAYLQEHRHNILADISAMANDLNRDAAALIRNPYRFNQVLTGQSRLRSLTEAIVTDSTGKVLARSNLSLALQFDLVPTEALAKADSGEIVTLTSETDDRVRAVIKLNRFVDAYLIVGRFVSARVLDNIESTRSAVHEYRQLEQRRDTILITFVMIFAVTAVLLLLAAVWMGMSMASRLTQPLSSLILAAGRVSEGDLAARVEASNAPDEIGSLGRAFNRMTTQLRSQQQGLIDANRELDERRRFTETVLAGVSAGVVGLDAEGRITLPNRSATELLGRDLEARLGHPLADAVPEMAAIVADCLAKPDRLHQSEVRLHRGGRALTLLVRMAAERLEGEIIGFVVTFDDVTELLAAQRQAAWADVARRIAHEIKNPLTPIQLSAERLKRRYLSEIQSDPETFTTCTDTIVRQVGDIGRMVDEFSSFARMPQAEIRAEDLSALCRDALFLERNRHAGIDYDLDLPDAPLTAHCDRRQISRALTNLLKNATESVEGRDRPADGSALPKGRVSLSARRQADSSLVRIEVSDNGRGLPEGDRERLVEPYVTTRRKGTGLGLAIVKKIMEDHDGDLVLEDQEGGGARIVLTFRDAGAGADQEPGQESGQEPSQESGQDTADGPEPSPPPQDRRIAHGQ